MPSADTADLPRTPTRRPLPRSARRLLPPTTPTRRLSRRRRTPRPSPRIQSLPMVKALNAGLRRALADDPKVLLLGEDIGPLGGVFRVTEGLQKEFGPQRVVDTPLAESGIIGTAIGLAMRGYRPVVEIQFDGFVFPGFDQITTQLAKMTNRHNGTLPVPGRHPRPVRRPHRRGRAPPGGPEAYFAHTAGLRVVAPVDPARRLLDDPGGHPFRRPRGLLRADEPLLAQGRGRPRREPDGRCTPAASSAPART